MNTKLDPLAIIEIHCKRFDRDGIPLIDDMLVEARAAVAELVEADRALDVAQYALVAAKREKGNYRVNSLGHAHPAVIAVRDAKARRSAALARFEVAA